MKLTTKSVAASLITLVAAASPALAFSSGVSTASFGVNGCNQCHSGGADPGVEILGPEVVRPLSTHEYRVRITAAPLSSQIAAGFNVSEPFGVLSPGGKYSKGTYAVGLPDEITHSAPKNASSGVVTFSFLWQAPAAGSLPTNLDAWGNSVNLAGGSSGDKSTQDLFSVGNAELISWCSAAPVSCTAPGKSLLAITDSADDAKDSVQFQWKNGPLLTDTDFGDPILSADYALCIYKGSTLIMELDVPAATGCFGVPCWKVSGKVEAPKGYKYKNKSGAPGGVQSISLAEGEALKSKARVKARGFDLADPAALPMLASIVTVQLVNTVNATCLGDVYSGLGIEILKDDGEKFKAKADYLP